MTALTQSSGRAVSLANLRPFAPGQSGNPGGKAKGLASLVRDQTRDGAELVEFMLGVLRGRKKAPLRLRMEAAAWLADRGFGRVAQPITADPEGASFHFTFSFDRPAERLQPQPDPDQEP